MFLEISQNSQENTCARVSFLINLQASDEISPMADSDIYDMYLAYQLISFFLNSIKQKYTSFQLLSSNEILKTVNLHRISNIIEFLLPSLFSLKFPFLILISIFVRKKNPSKNLNLTKLNFNFNIVGNWLSSPKQKSQCSQNKFIWYKTMLPLQNQLFYWPFLQQKYLISNKISKIADLTCKIMRKFLFPTYSSLYVRL